MTTLAVRRATLADLDALVRFNSAMALETEGKELSSAVLAEGVRSVLEDPSKGFYVVAEADGAVVGSLLVTPEWSDWRSAYYWWIQSVYVAPEYRRRGVYTALHRYVEESARASGNVCGLRLYVERGNSTARRAYERLGMTRSRYELYESADLSGAKRRNG